MPSVRPIPGKPGHFVDQAGNVIVLTEARDTARYDTVQRAAGVLTAGTTLNWFRNTDDKIDIDNNCPEAGKLVTGAERLILESIGFDIESSNSTLIPGSGDYKRILCHAYLELKLNKNTIAEGPAVMFPSGLGVYGNTTENATAICSNGVPSMQTVRPLKEQQIVTDHHTVKATCTFQARTWLSTDTQPTTLVQTTLRLYCHGILEQAATNN